MGPDDCPVLREARIGRGVYNLSLSPWMVVVGNGLGDISMVF